MPSLGNLHYLYNNDLSKEKITEDIIPFYLENVGIEVELLQKNIKKLENKRRKNTVTIIREKTSLEFCQQSLNEIQEFREQIEQIDTDGKKMINR